MFCTPFSSLLRGDASQVNRCYVLAHCGGGGLGQLIVFVIFHLVGSIEAGITSFSFVEGLYIAKTTIPGGRAAGRLC